MKSDNKTVLVIVKTNLFRNSSNGEGYETLFVM